MSRGDEPEDREAPDGRAVELSGARPGDELDKVEPDEIVVRIADDRAIVFAAHLIPVPSCTPVPIA